MVHIRAFEARAMNAHAAKIGLLQAGLGEIGAAEVGAIQHRPVQVRAFQICLAEMGAREFDFIETALAQIDAGRLDELQVAALAIGFAPDVALMRLYRRDKFRFGTDGILCCCTDHGRSRPTFPVNVQNSTPSIIIG